MLASELRHILPAPHYQPIRPAENTLALTNNAPLYPQKKKPSLAPPYGSRVGWIPRAIEDYGDGGAFPEIHVAQYPLNMGKKGGNSQTQQEGQIVSLTTDESGNVNYDAVVKQGHSKGVVVWTKNISTKEKDVDPDELHRPTEEEEDETAKKTLELLQAKLSKKAADANPATNVQDKTPKYIRYTPANQSASFNSGASHRIIRMVEAPKDPLEPPKFKHVKSHGVPGSPPVPVLHSPPRNLSKEERDAWKIPPCISNWKNSKGFMVPLDKRVATDGRGLQEHSINDSFAKFSEALYIAERNAREEVTKRLNIKRELELRQQQEREEELRRIAQRARMERNKLHQLADNVEETAEERKERVERELIREDRRLERERETRLANRGRESAKSKLSRDARRDISEKIALTGMVPQTADSLFDSRLFNQTAGMDSGFGDDEDYNIYDKRLFGGERERALYKAYKPEESELYGDATSIDDMANAKRFKPHKEFQGTEKEPNAPNNPRTGPVQFERDQENEEAFALVNEFIKEAKERAGGREEGGRGGGRETEGRTGLMHAAEEAAAAPKNTAEEPTKK